MAVKKYRLSPKASQFIKGPDDFRFRLRFSQSQEGGGLKIRELRACPILELKPRGVVQTENEIAQRMIEGFQIPTITKRDNTGYDPGPMFEDYTGGAPTDLDLDPIFEAVP